MSSEKVKANNAKLSACLTCLLCNNWFTNATTISECLHTFCKECINKKLIDEKLDHCPICKVDLGCSPQDKLRTDNSLQEIRDKIFPREGNNAKPPSDVPSVTLPTITNKKCLTLSSIKAKARRAKAAARKVFTPQESDLSARKVCTPQESELSASKPDDIVADVQKDEECNRIEILDEATKIPSARKAKAVARIKFIRSESAPTCRPRKVARDEKKDGDKPQLEASNTRVQNSSKSDSTQQIELNKISQNNADIWKEKADLYEPLNSLVVAGSKIKCSNKSTMQENAVIPMLVDSSNNGSQVPFNRMEAASDQIEPTPPKSNSVKLKFTEDLNSPAQSVIGPESESNNGFSPIWFALVASEEKDVGARLPQIPSRYLRVKDGTLPVSYIKKYLVRKLGLASETEVEITLHGRPVLSSLQLQNLVELWLQTVPKNETIQTSVGSSAMDFIMVLSYFRKA